MSFKLTSLHPLVTTLLCTISRPADTAMRAAYDSSSSGPSGMASGLTAAARLRRRIGGAAMGAPLL
jgi:hypothetical protein